MSGKTVLVVDDEEIIRDVLSTVLKNKGYAVTTAGTAKEALSLLRTPSFDLALVDIRLPDIQGTVLLESMRASDAAMIIILMTGDPDLESAMDAVNRGANGYIVKPFGNADLVALVDRKIREHDTAQALTDEKVSAWLEDRLLRLDRDHTDTPVNLP